ncbi:MAG: hypothetical protein KDA25_05250, partial [Phycisphaerales bacterium]|nr:hypothetical protein [Phycisphaerales bacterium]
MERLRRLRRLLRRSTPVAARGPFSNEDPTTPRDHVRRDQRLRAMGVRLLPHPFASLMTIMSDIDAAERADAEAYRRQLVEVHGLDFGDSFRLALRTHGRMGSEAFALYHCTGAPPPAGDADRDLDTTCTFLEIVRAYHLGHVDHLHGLSGMGPRVAWLRDVRTGGADTVDVMVPADFEIEKRGSMNVRSDFMPVLRIAVLAPARLPATTDVRFIDASGREIATLARLEDPAAHATGVHTDDVATWFAPPESLSPVRLGDIACVRISGGGTVRAVAMVNLARPHLKAMLRDLGDRWQVRPCLYTDHGAKGFLTATSEAHHASGNAACLADATAAALYARVVDPAYGYS